MMLIQNEGFTFTLVLQLVRERPEATLQDLCDYIDRQVAVTTDCQPSELIYCRKGKLEGNNESQKRPPMQSQRGGS